MLTVRQRELLSLVAVNAARGHTPSYLEMSAALGIRSKSGVARLVDGLIERGFLRKHPARPRSLEIVRLPAGQPILGKPAAVDVPLRGSLANGWFRQDSDDGRTVAVAGAALPRGAADLMGLRVLDANCAALGLLAGDILVMARDVVPARGMLCLVPQDGGETLGRMVSVGRSHCLELPDGQNVRRAEIGHVRATSVLLLRAYN